MVIFYPQLDGGGNGIQQNDFDHPDQDLGKEQGDQVRENTCDQNGSCWLLSPRGMAEPDHTLHADRDEKGVDHFLLKRRRITNPISRPAPQYTSTRQENYSYA